MIKPCGPETVFTGCIFIYEVGSNIWVNCYTLCRHNGAHPDSHGRQISTDKVYKQSPHASVHGFSHPPEPTGHHPRGYVRSTWTGDESGSEHQYAGDSADDLHEHGALESPRGYRDHAELKHLRKHAQNQPKKKPQKDRFLHTSSDEDDYEAYMQSSRARVADRHPQNITKHETDGGHYEQGMHHALKGRVRDGGANLNRGAACEVRVRLNHGVRRRDLSPFDANVEDYEREWEHVLLEATGGAQLGQQTGGRKSRPGESTDAYGEAWGLREDWGDRRTESGYSQVGASNSMM